MSADLHLSFPQKKNPVPAWEEDGRINPAVRDLSMYFCMAILSGADKEYRRPLGGIEPGSKLMVQSYGW